MPPAPNLSNQIWISNLRLNIEIHMHQRISEDKAPSLVEMMTMIKVCTQWLKISSIVSKLYWKAKEGKAIRTKMAQVIILMLRKKILSLMIGIGMQIDHLLYFTIQTLVKDVCTRKINESSWNLRQLIIILLLLVDIWYSLPKILLISLHPSYTL